MQQNINIRKLRKILAIVIAVISILTVINIMVRNSNLVVNTKLFWWDMWLVSPYYIVTRILRMENLFDFFEYASGIDKVISALFVVLSVVISIASVAMLVFSIKEKNALAILAFVAATVTPFSIVTGVVMITWLIITKDKKTDISNGYTYQGKNKNNNDNYYKYNDKFYSDQEKGFK